ncbi:right-handed parallel beta-helix repeat-containing protein [Vibrio mimicus]
MNHILCSLALLGFSISAEPIYLEVTEFGAIANDGIDDSIAFQNALNKLEHGNILVIPSGEYQICKTIYLKEKNDIEIIGLANSKLKKCSGFSGEYLLSVFYTQNLKLHGLIFEGLNDGDQNPIWGEQGIYLGSTKGSLVTQNQFHRFGDAALRITTASQDNSASPGSQSITVSDNRFEKCAQVTTTQATVGTEMAGTQNIIVDNNQFIGCKLKLSARADTRGAEVRNNLFAHINGTSNEVSYYSDVSYINNRFYDIHGFAINIYPNSRTTKIIQWENISIIGNTFDTIQQGIRLQSFSKHDEANKPIKNIQVKENHFSNIYFGSNIENQYKAIIRTNTQDKNVSFDGVNIANNQYQLTPYSQFTSIDTKSTSVTINNNSRLYDNNTDSNTIKE